MSEPKLPKSAVELLTAMQNGEEVTFHPYPSSGLPYFRRASGGKCAVAAKALQAAGLIKTERFPGSHYSWPVVLVDPAEAARNREAQRQAERDQRAASEWRTMYSLLQRIALSGMFADEINELMARIEGGK